jgi:hypothetical protein
MKRLSAAMNACVDSSETTSKCTAFVAKHTKIDKFALVVVRQFTFSIKRNRHWHLKMDSRW